MLNYRITFTLTASSLEDASANTALSLPKQMQISLQACCRCVLLYCCLTNYPNGRVLRCIMFLWVSSPGTVYLDHPGHLALYLRSRPHPSQGSPGMEPLFSFLTHPQCCGRIQFLAGYHQTPQFFQKLWRELPELMKVIRSSLGWGPYGCTSLPKVMNLYTSVYQLNFMYVIHDDSLALKIKLS